MYRMFVSNSFFKKIITFYSNNLLNSLIKFFIKGDHKTKTKNNYFKKRVQVEEDEDGEKGSEEVEGTEEGGEEAEEEEEGMQYAHLNHTKMN